MASLKARCYTALLKLVATRYFLKAHYYTAIFLQNLTKSKCYFGTYFTKPDIILAPIFTKLKYYFGKNNYIILKSPKLFLGKNISSYTKIPNLWEI